jgi:hypothetical protein
LIFLSGAKRYGGMEYEASYEASGIPRPYSSAREDSARKYFR